TIEIDLATSSADAMPPDALQRNARFVDSSETAELSDFELALGMGFVSPSRTGTIAIEGPLTDAYAALGRLAASLMERNLEWLYRTVASGPYPRSITDLVGDADLTYIRRYPDV